ncbi:MAG: aspartate aminotransferase family protein [Firmicutes bacterium]|nr:aspartate aminotransferase family protein [Bacillota bacterium]
MPETGLLTLDAALSLTRQEVVGLHQKYLNSALVNLMSLIDFTKRFVKAEGFRVWDQAGQEYLDFLGGYGALNLGHNHPKVLAALAKVQGTPNLLQASLNNLAGALAHNLAQITPGKLQRSFFCNSGAEAVEGALKLARIATGKTKIISAENSFHGKSFGALSATGRFKYQKPFGPLVPDFLYFPFGDLGALEKLLQKKDVAAVILEPVQAEGGIIVPPPGFIDGARKLCNQYQALLILDEIQTGFGRTGAMFACEAEGVEPDIMCLSKSLGGGVMPIGVYIATDAVWQRGYGGVEKATLHSSTFGGNSLACAAALAAIEAIYEERLADNARVQGEYFLGKLRDLKQEFKLIKDVRGRGLLLGIEFEQPEGLLNNLTGGMLSQVAAEYTGSMVAGKLMNDYRIITAYTLNNLNVIRLEPPLAITRKEIDYLLGALRAVLSEHKGFISLAVATGKNLLKKK